MLARGGGDGTGVGGWDLVERTRRTPMDDYLRLAKQRLVGTRAGSALRRMTWWAAFPQRVRHPELWDMYLEDERTGQLFDRLVQPDWNCIDVGAHIGSVLHRLIELAPDGYHIAVEPTPEKAAWLRKRFPRVTVVEAAAYDSDGSATFHQATQSGYSGLARSDDTGMARTYPVDLVRLDSVIGPDTKVDLLKIDTEGAELLALRGSEGILRRHQPAVLFECGPHGKPEPFGYSRLDLFDFLTDAGYQLYSVADALYHRPPMGRDEFDRAGLYPYRGFNYLALPAGRPLPE